MKMLDMNFRPLRAWVVHTQEPEYTQASMCTHTHTTQKKSNRKTKGAPTHAQQTNTTKKKAKELFRLLAPAKVYEVTVMADVH